MTDTTTPTVETLAKHYDEEARFLEVAQAVGDEGTVRYAATCKATAATLRALVQERDALVKERNEYESPAWEANERLNEQRDELIAERDAARAALQRLVYAWGDEWRVGIRGDEDVTDIVAPVLGPAVEDAP